MSPDAFQQRRSACVAWVEAMHHALVADDETAFKAALEGFTAAQDASLVSGVRKVADNLQAALEQFRADSRLVDLAERQVPDARARLAHVLKLTDEAAHHTMDLVDQSCPLVDQVATAAVRLVSPDAIPPGQGQPRWSEVESFLHETVAKMQAVRGRMTEVLLAQGYQDLSGQILRSVMKLVDELEVALGELVRIGNLQDVSDAATVRGPGASHGPVVPGVAHGVIVKGQQDVDAMLSDLGF